MRVCVVHFFFFSSRRRHTRFDCDWSSDVCSSDLLRTSARERMSGDDHRLPAFDRLRAPRERPAARDEGAARDARGGGSCGGGPRPRPRGGGGRPPPGGGGGRGPGPRGPPRGPQGGREDQGAEREAYFV